MLTNFFSLFYLDGWRLYIDILGEPVNVYSQIAGFLGFFLILYAYPQKKFKFLVISGISYIIFMAEGFFLFTPENNTLSNVIGNATSFLRNMTIIYVYAKHNKDLPTWASFPFLAIYWIGALPTLGTWYTYIPPVATTVYTLSAIQKNYYILKAGALFLEGIFMFYHFKTGAYVGAIRQIVLVFVISYSMIRLYLEDKKKTADTQPTPTEEAAQPAPSETV